MTFSIEFDERAFKEWNKLEKNGPRTIQKEAKKTAAKPLR